MDDKRPTVNENNLCLLIFFAKFSPLIKSMPKIESSINLVLNYFLVLNWLFIDIIFILHFWEEMDMKTGWKTCRNTFLQLHLRLISLTLYFPSAQFFSSDFFFDSGEKTWKVLWCRVAQGFVSADWEQVSQFLLSTLA